MSFYSLSVAKQLLVVQQVPGHAIRTWASLRDSFEWFAANIAGRDHGPLMSRCVRAFQSVDSVLAKHESSHRCHTENILPILRYDILKDGPVWDPQQTRRPIQKTSAKIRLDCGLWSYEKWPTVPWYPPCPPRRHLPRGTSKILAYICTSSCCSKQKSKGYAKAEPFLLA